MEYTRRRLLTLTGASGLTAIAGCGASSGPPEDDQEETYGTLTVPNASVTQIDATTQTATPTSTQTTTGPPPVKTETEKVASNDGDSGDRFGSAAALSDDGTTALIGAQYDDDPNGQFGGSAYVFERVDGEWSQQAKLATTEDAVSDFGSSVDLSSNGRTALIGAPSRRRKNGAAYIFTKANGSWIQQTKLTAGDDSNPEDRFGDSVALSADGSRALIGADQVQHPDREFTGAAYVFDRVDATWRQEHRLIPDDVDPSSSGVGIGIGLSGDGNTALVSKAGADGEPRSACIFSYSDEWVVGAETNGSWEQTGELTASDGEAGDRFAWTSALSPDGETILVGAYGDYSSTGRDGGSVYVFVRGEDGWQQQTKVVAAGSTNGGGFGRSLGLSNDGETAVISAWSRSEPNGEFAGAAFFLTSSDGEWEHQTVVAAGDGDSRDQFGTSTAISGSGEIALIGAVSDEDPNGGRAGSAYVFNWSG